MSLVNPTLVPASDPDLLNGQAVLCEFLDTINIDPDDDVSNVYNVCSSIHP